VILYDADRVLEAASTPDPQRLYQAQRDLLLDPRDPKVAADAEASGIPADWIEAACRSPLYKLIHDYQIALPLHPEYRTLPMVWYVPPLSPVVDVVRDTGHDGEDAGNLFAAIDALRIPIDYLAGLFTAGDPEPVRAVLARLAAMRSYMRDINLGRDADEAIPAAVGMTAQQIGDMYRLLAVAKYEDRYVIPRAHGEPSADRDMGCSLDHDGGPGMGGPGANGNGRVNLLNWDGKGRPEGMFPPRPAEPAPELAEEGR
jgi:nitrate reductase beta subunit